VTLWNDGVEPCEITLQISDPPGSHPGDLLICSDGCAFWSGEGSDYGTIRVALNGVVTCSADLLPGATDACHDGV